MTDLYLKQTLDIEGLDFWKMKETNLETSRTWGKMTMLRVNQPVCVCVWT